MNQTVFLIVYIIFIMALLILPSYLSNKKKKKAFDEMMDGLKVGDKIITTGGIHATVVNILTETIEVKIDKNARMTISKSSISSVVK